MSDIRPIEKLRGLMDPGPQPVNFDVEQRRTNMKQMAKNFGYPDDVSIEAATIAGIECEWVSIPGSAEDHVVVWMHGGGFSAGSCFTHRGLAGEVARYSKARVLTINYRLSPENPFPAGQDDVDAVYAEVAKMAGIAKLAIVGDSAGGALALAAAITAQDAAMRTPDAIALYSPWLDLRCTSNSYASRAVSDPMIHPNILRTLAKEYLENTAPDNRRASPVLADLSGLPPILLQVGSDEVLLDDSLLLDRLGREMGVDITLEVWSEMVHVFQAFPAMLPEAQAALEQTGRFFRKTWEAA